MNEDRLRRLAQILNNIFAGQLGGNTCETYTGLELMVTSGGRLCLYRFHSRMEALQRQAYGFRNFNSYS